jgi:hypothetical protein
MRRRASFSLVLLALVVAAACVLPVPVASKAPPGAVCEFFGARFAPPVGWQVEEKRETTEPVGRAALTGWIGKHLILLSIIPRELRTQTGEPTVASQAQLYFRSLRAALESGWTDVQETRFDSPARSYPVLVSRTPPSGPLPARQTQQENAILLYFPDDFPRGRYFYVFFWTDTHPAEEEPASLTELRNIVDSFTVNATPTTASKGCGA